MQHSGAFKSETSRGLTALYGGNTATSNDQLVLYSQLYQLPLYTHSEVVTPELFRYCKRRSFFVKIIAIQDDRVFLKRTIGTQLQWELPGSAIQSFAPESPEDAVLRIINRDIPNIDICELQPIAILRKEYSLPSSEAVDHYGLTFVGRVRRPEYREILKKEDIKGSFVKFSDSMELTRLTKLDRRLLALAVERARSLQADIETFNVDSEIDSHSNLPQWRQSLHKLTKFIGKSSSRTLRQVVLTKLADCSSVIDVACGDDVTIFDLAASGKTVIANDVIWPHVYRHNRNHGPNQQPNWKIIHTNHDAKYLPFKNSISGVLCKNVLHHMDCEASLKALFESLYSTATSRIVIIDPENPQLGKLRARIWNKYYRKVLDDQGEKFYSEDLFRNLISDFFTDRGCSVNIEKLLTIKGYFLVASIQKQIEANPDDGSGPPERLKVVIFDLDGLLVDSEHVFASSTIEALGEVGVTRTVSDYVDADLQNGKSLLASLHEKGVIRDVGSVERRVYELYRQRLHEVSALPGAVESVRAASQKYTLGLCTSSRREFAEAMLERLGILDCFSHRVCREDVANQKPDPEGLREVLKQAKVSPGEAIVVEDSKRGLRASVNADIPCILIPNALTDGVAYPDASAILDSLIELTPEMLNKVWSFRQASLMRA